MSLMCHFSLQEPMAMPWGPKTGSNRARNTANMLSDVLFFLVFNVSLWIWGDLIIREWLILTPGHTAILFGTFLERPKIDQTWTLRPRIYHKNTSKILEIWEPP